MISTMMMAAIMKTTTMKKTSKSMAVTKTRFALLLAAATLFAPGLTRGQDDAVESNPTIIALEESNPRSPEQLMFAIQVAMGFDRDDVLQKYATQLMAANLDDAGKVAMHRSIGSRIFLTLNDSKKYGQELSDYAKSVLIAVGEYSKREDRLQQLAQQAQSDDEVARRTAVVELLKGGDAAAPILLNAMAGASGDIQLARLRTALMAMQQDAIAPLISALQSDNAAIVSQACQALGLMKSQTAVPYLARLSLNADHPSMSAAKKAMLRIVGVTPTRPEAIVFLRRKIDAFRRGDLPARPDLDGRVRTFRWDNEGNTSIASKAPIEQAVYGAAAHLSRDLAALSDEAEDQLNSLLVQLQDAQLRAGADQLLSPDSATWKMAAKTKPEQLELALLEAVKRKWTPAATAALQALGASGDLTLLESKEGRAGAVARALVNEDRRIRYAAMRAVMAMDPKTPYAGSSDFINAIKFFILSSGARQVLVAHPNQGQGQTTVALIAAQDYQGRAFTRGRELIRNAQANPNVELILISSMVTRPNAAETMQLLRQDPRTSRLPIGIFAAADQLKFAESIAREDERTIALPRLHSVAGAAIHLRRLDEIRPDVTPQASRIIQAMAALRMLDKLTADREQYSFYEVFQVEEALISAVQRETLTAQAAHILGLLGTARTQQTLLRMTLDQALPEESREAALGALVAAVKLRGLQLTNAQIREQQAALSNAPVSNDLSKRMADAVLNLFQGKPVGGAAEAADPS